MISTADYLRIKTAIEHILPQLLLNSEFGWRFYAEDINAKDTNTNDLNSKKRRMGNNGGRNASGIEVSIYKLDNPKKNIRARIFFQVPRDSLSKVYFNYPKGVNTVQEGLSFLTATDTHILIFNALTNVLPSQLTNESTSSIIDDVKYNPDVRNLTSFCLQRYDSFDKSLWKEIARYKANKKDGVKKGRKNRMYLSPESIDKISYMQMAAFLPMLKNILK